MTTRVYNQLMYHFYSRAIIHPSTQSNDSVDQIIYVLLKYTILSVLLFADEKDIKTYAFQITSMPHSNTSYVLLLTQLEQMIFCSLT